MRDAEKGDVPAGTVTESESRLFALSAVVLVLIVVLSIGFHPHSQVVNVV